MNYIDLYTDSQSWIAKFRGPHAEIIRQRFSTVSLPLPFTGTASFEAVLRDVAQRYPDAQVSCLHRNTYSVPGVGVVNCRDCGMRW